MPTISDFIKVPKTPISWANFVILAGGVLTVGSSLIVAIIEGAVTWQQSIKEVYQSERERESKLIEELGQSFRSKPNGMPKTPELLGLAMYGSHAVPLLAGSLALYGYTDAPETEMARRAIAFSLVQISTRDEGRGIVIDSMLQLLKAPHPEPGYWRVREVALLVLKGINAQVSNTTWLGIKAEIDRSESAETKRRLLDLMPK
jgi:hypothetical protein